MGAAQKLPTESVRTDVLFTSYDQPHIAGSMCSKLSSYGKGAHGGWNIYVDAVGVHAEKEGVEHDIPWPRVRNVIRTKVTE